MQWKRKQSDTHWTTEWLNASLRWEFLACFSVCLMRSHSLHCPFKPFSISFFFLSQRNRICFLAEECCPYESRREIGCFCAFSLTFFFFFSLCVSRTGEWLSACPSELRRNPVLSYTFHTKQPEGIPALMSTVRSELAKFRLFLAQTPSNILISICFWKNSWLTMFRSNFTLRVI